MKDRSKRRSMLVLLGLLVVALATATSTSYPAQPQATATRQKAAWESRWEKVLAAARQEGRVVVTSCPGEARRSALAKGFEQAFPGIKVEHMPFNSRDLWPKVVREAQLGQHNFDVRIGGADTTTYAVMNQNNTHAPIVFDEWFILPEARDPAIWLGGIDGVWLDVAKKFMWPIRVEKSEGIAFWVNRNLIPRSELQTVEQIANPKWKGKVVSLSAEGGAAQNTLIGQWLKFGDDWLQGVMANKPVVIRDHRQQIEMLIRGQFAIATTLDTTVLDDFKQRGVDLSLIEPLRDEALGWTNGCESLQLHNNMPHPNAAKVYVNWLFSRHQQQAFNTVLRANSRRLDIKSGDLSRKMTVEELKRAFNGQEERYEAERKRFVSLVQDKLIK